MDTYTDVQFIGYALTTTPEVTTQLGFPSFVEGQYTGIEPPVADIDARVEMMMSALRQTAASGAVDPSPSTLKIFVMPEFALRGPRGAYDNHPPVIDYFTYFRKELQRCVSDAAWQGWLFVAGTIVETVGYVRGNDPALDHKAIQREKVAVALAEAWTNANTSCPVAAGKIQTALNAFADYCRHDPLYQVTDRCYVIAGGAPDPVYPHGLSVQKKFMSNEDFVLNLYGKVVTEDQCSYPEIPENDGENKVKAFDDYSIFTIGGIRFGLEICLDHYKARLRTNRQPLSELVQIQLVPSCGMTIQQAAIVAGPGGLVFNCDGQVGGAATPADSLWSYTSSGHAELTQVATACGDGPPAANAVNAQLTMPPVSNATPIPIDAPASAKLYAYGPGEVFVFQPLPVPPPVGAEMLAGAERHG